ncbi:hypothetical protein ACRRTK_010588 [Alexandromys fortis]
MTMCCKMMRLSSVSAACEEAVCSQQNLPPFFLSPSFSCLFLLPPPVHTLPKQTREVANNSPAKPFGIILSFTDTISSRPCHEPQCTKLFLSTDIKYLDLL